MLTITMELLNNYSSKWCPSLETNYSDFSINLTDVFQGVPTDTLSIVKTGNQFYAYFTPLILVIGLLGNTLSLIVFMSKNMRGMSASRYLATLSVADISTLIFYVLSEWFVRGLVHISPEFKPTFLAKEGICQVWLYLNYMSRFLSAWVIVCFTFERYVGVCMPFKRRQMGSLKGTMKIIITLVVTSVFVVLYKPMLSGVHKIHGETRCTSIEAFVYLSFILDSIYALSITLIPFVIITVLNLLIIKRLYRRNRRHKHKLITEESHIRLEFTFILLAISFVFIAFNLPYFIIWMRMFIHSLSSETGTVGVNETDFWVGVLTITRTIFYMNYCFNFFLYSITGAFFRRELVGLFRIQRGGYQSCRQQSNNTNDTPIGNRNSWV